MHILVTAGPTREYIDAVRFITNGSSGRMGYAVAAAAARRGHTVTLLTGPVGLKPPAARASGKYARPTRIRVVPFVSVEDLAAAMRKHFDAADAVVMAAAVGDFRPEKVLAGKLRRADGPITLRLVPTQDVLAAVAAKKRKGQIVFAFAVESGPRREIVAKARAEMARKYADFVLLNTPAAMGAEESAACILSPEGVVLPWARRPKAALASAIVRMLEERANARPLKSPLKALF
jgi:phosphopantothenoylcysteine decarboxylase/phosphopantothenate--cysteine ligase